MSPYHIPHFFRRHEALCEPDPKPASLGGGRWATSFEKVSCHRCLELVVQLGESAVQQIIALDKKAAEDPGDGMQPCRTCKHRNVLADRFIPLLCQDCLREKLQAVENSRSVARAVVVVDGDYYQK